MQPMGLEVVPERRTTADAQGDGQQPREEQHASDDAHFSSSVTIGRDANTGAGSVITKDVPDGALAVERSEQRTVEGYRERKDAERRRRTSRKKKAT